MVAHSSCNNCGKEEEWQWVKGRSATTKICRDIELELKDGTQVKLPWICETEGPIEDMNCKLDNSRSSIKDLASK